MRIFNVRILLRISILSILVTSQSSWGFGQKSDGTEYGTAKYSQTVVSSMAGKSLQELRDLHRRELDEDYQGYWKDHGIDWENGGVMPYRELMVGMPYLAKHYYLKQMYFQGRALWTFSYLYNHFGQDKRNLSIAQHTKDFIYKYANNGDYTWACELTPEGEVVQRYSDIDGDFYVALGLAEFSKATGDTEALETALNTIYKANSNILAPDFMFYGAWDARRVFPPGSKFLGIWLHFLNTLLPVGDLTHDSRVEQIANMCVRNIVEHHWRPERGSFVEILDQDFNPMGMSHHDANWHGVQSAWMCMWQALRTDDQDLFMRAMEMGRIQLRRGFTSEFENIDINAPLEDLPRWGPLEDYMLFCLIAIEHTHAPWAVYWYDKVFKFAYQRPDRFEQYDLLHQPRRLFYTIEILDRMIDREGRVSDFLEE